MGRPRSTAPPRAPPLPPSKVSPDHLHLLQSFGRNQLLRENASQVGFKEKLWESTCVSANLPVVPYDKVVAAWRELASGKSSRSSVSLTNEIEPSVTIVQFNWDRRVYCTHPIRTRTLLRSLLRLFSHCFKTEEEFIQDVRSMCLEIAEQRGPG